MLSTARRGMANEAVHQVRLGFLARTLKKLSLLQDMTDDARDAMTQPELLQLARDISERYDASINIDELVAILSFVSARHKISHASLTEASSIVGSLGIVASARGLCTERWSLEPLKYQRVMMKVIFEYERVILGVRKMGLESNKAVRGGRFTGWLWEIAGLVEGVKKEREREKEMEAGHDEGPSTGWP